eukprot:3847269-Pleurochrysis_carterae.AAC.1
MGGRQAVAAHRAKAETLDEVWLLGGSEQLATWCRMASLRALGVAAGDDQPVSAGRVAEFLANVAYVAGENGHVALALRVAAQETAHAGEGALVAAPSAESRGLAAAGHDCATAL